MFAHTGVLSLAFSLVVSQTAAISLDTSNQDSIKAAAKTLAGGIIAAYKESLANESIPGLFPSPYYWWEAGTVFHGLIEYSHLTGDSQYDSLVSAALQWQTGEHDAFMPTNQTKVLGNDDQSYWGLAAMTAAEVGFPKPSKLEWVKYAQNVFDTQVARLDIEEANNTCGGGLRWQIFSFNNGYEYKNAVSNSNFFLLAARLAKFTGNETFTKYAEKSYDWANTVGLIKDFAVFDGADAKGNCSTINKIQWSSTHAKYLEGAALMYNITASTQKWADAVKGFANHASVFLGKDSSILYEVACETNGRCDIDQRAFKGITVRSFARAAIAAPFISDTMKKIIEASAKGAAGACNGDSADVSCSLSWKSDPYYKAASAKKGNLGEVFNAMEVVQVLLYPQAKALATANSNGQTNGNATQGAKPSGASGAPGPQSTNAAGSVVVSVTSVLAVAFAAMMSL